MESTHRTTTSVQFEVHGEPPILPRQAPGETVTSLAEIAHEARNIVAALGLYCDLLDEPGVFAEPYRHYKDDLKMVASASRGLVNRLLTLSGPENSTTAFKLDPEDPNTEIRWPRALVAQSKAARYWQELSPSLIHDLAWEIQANRSLLAALAGPSITLSVETVGGALPVCLSSEDLTRILVNLVKNSVEAMPGSGGRIRLVLRECPGCTDEETRLLLNFEDNGTGIAPASLERIFETGYTTRSKTGDPGDTLQAAHRGLGLSIVRTLVEAAGGDIRAANRDPVGACIQIELPVRTTQL